MKLRLSLLLLTLLFVVHADSVPTLQREQITVPIRELGPIAPVTAKDTSRWVIKKGKNADLKTQFGVNAGSVEILQIAAGRLDRNLKDGAANWFTMQTALSASPLWQQADGIGLVLGVKRAGTWWMSLELNTDTNRFSQVVEPYHYDRADTLVCRLLPFDLFKARDGAPLDRNRINSLTLVNGLADNTLYLEKIFLYRRSEQQWQVAFSSSNPKTSIFERGQPIRLTFTSIVAKSGSNPDALAIKVTDYFERTIATKNLKPETNDRGQRLFKVDFASLPSGYYEVRAWPLDAGGRRLSPDSCIKATGSQPQGKATFAVMPRTIAENHARSARLGEQAFFGLHGNFADLADLLGTTWQLDGDRWIWREPQQRPDRTSGPAPWAAKALTEPTAPAWSYSLVNLSINHQGFTPAWARTTTPDLLPNYKWDDFAAFFRDTVKVTQHRFPHQRNHLYDITWEINLNSPETAVHKPYYRPADVIDIYRRTRPLLQQADPNAKMLGPCAASLGMYDWTEELFRLGIRQYLDAFNFHGYNAPPPEKSKVPEKIRELHRLLRKYNNGQDLPMYCTELGYRSLYGAADRHREQAQWHVRVAIMLKGEGVQTYFPFYGYDFSNDKESWGLNYTLDPARKFPPPAVMPKAATPGLAVCIDQLEGMAPLSDLPWFGSDIYGYFFRNGQEIILAVWSVDAPQRISLPVGKPSTPIEIIDMMGGKTAASVKNDRIEIALSSSPVYLRHLPPEIYGDGIKANDVTVAAFPGPVDHRVTEPGLYLLSPGMDGRPARWLAVRNPVEIVAVDPTCVNRQKGIEVKVANRGKDAMPVELSIDSAMTGKTVRQLNLPGGSVKTIIIPVTETDPGKAAFFTVTAGTKNAPAVSLVRKINFLAARRRGQPSSPELLPNTISWQGIGSSGQKQTAAAELEWDDQNFYLTVTDDDDSHRQSNRDSGIWQQDSLQIAFDTNPESDEVYNPLAGIFTKKITSMAFALTDKNEVVAWRHDTHNPQELRSGDIRADVKAEITRNEAKRQTVYRLNIPWRKIGIDQVKPGKTLGFDLLLNDYDQNGERRGIELFGGIMNDRHYSRFGSVILQ